MLRWPIGLVMLAACGSSSGSQDRADVFFENTEPVPRDPTHTNGWDYDPATMRLTLYGSYCGRIQDRSVDDVDVVFGCPDPTVL